MSTTTPPTRFVELLDGGTGEELFKRGLQDDRKVWSASALVQDANHELLVQVHESFLRAGSDYITCNNYGVTPGVGFAEVDIVKYTAVAGMLAQKARTLAGKPAAKICGSLPPLLESYRADCVMEHNDGVHMYAVIGSALLPYVDEYLAETLSSVAEAKMALEAVQDFQKPVMVSFTLNSHGKLRSGECVNDAVEELLHFTNSRASVSLSGILFNCSQPEDISKALRVLHAAEELQTRLRERNIRLGAYANRLTQIPDDWAFHESTEAQTMRKDLDSEQYADYVSEWIGLGAELIGGCCGIGPEYIHSIHERLVQQGYR
ncbi:Homocysteine s-methyltransferase, partial [Globisporangium splendens]